MRLLVITQYFWPEDFRINELVNDFCRRGYEVSIITGQPNYPEGKIHTDFIKNKRRYNKFATAHVVRARVPARGNSKISLMFNYISFIILASIKSFFTVEEKNLTIFLFLNLHQLQYACLQFSSRKFLRFQLHFGFLICGQIH